MDPINDCLCHRCGEPLVVAGEGDFCVNDSCKYKNIVIHNGYDLLSGDIIEIEEDNDA